MFFFSLFHMLYFIIIKHLSIMLKAINCCLKQLVITTSLLGNKNLLSSLYAWKRSNIIQKYSECFSFNLEISSVSS